MYVEYKNENRSRPKRDNDLFVSFFGGEGHMYEWIRGRGYREVKTLNVKKKTVSFLTTIDWNKK